jgi:hypothetical protein
LTAYFVAGVVLGQHARWISGHMCLRFGILSLSSFWKTPAWIWRGRKGAVGDDDVVAGAAGEQLRLDDVVGIEDVVDDLDAGLLREVGQHRLVDT